MVRTTLSRHIFGHEERAVMFRRRVSSAYTKYFDCMVCTVA